MSSEEFIKKCKTMVKEFTNEHIDKTDNVEIKTENVFVVWYCKTLQNHKALLSTTLPDKMYYEVTYNGDEEEFYLDAYVKLHNEVRK